MLLRLRPLLSLPALPLPKLRPLKPPLPLRRLPSRGRLGSRRIWINGASRSAGCAEIAKLAPAPLADDQIGDARGAQALAHLAIDYLHSR